MTDTPRKKLTLKRTSTSTSPAEPSEPLEQQEQTSTRSARLAGKRIIRREELPVSKAAKTHPTKTASDQQTKSSRPIAKKPIAKPQKSKALSTEPTPSKLQIIALNEKLCEMSSVWINYQPLGIGIEEHILKFAEQAQLPASKRVIQRLLRMHCQHGKYLQAVLDGHERYNLEGEITGSISAEEKLYANRTLESREPFHTN